MIFDSEFLCIVSGEVKNVRNSQNMPSGEVFSYGNELNYINCGFIEKIRRECPVSEANNYLTRMRERLQNENVHPRTLALVMRASIGAFENDMNVFDYNA
jgi:hypothetical protein